MSKKHKVITIDGPVASGKSTLAQMLAKKLGFFYLNTGLLYRAVAYVLIHIQKLSTLPDDLSFIKDIRYEYDNGVPLIIYRGDNITSCLYTPGLDAQASVISADNRVRTLLLDVQRSIAHHYNIVADGRDCGSVIFPTAEIKFFLTADVDTRAQRLFNNKKRAYAHMTLDEIKTSVQERDERDTKRDIAPLQIPEGGVVVDNSILDQQQTLDVLCDTMKNKKRPI